ncbi:MAG: hypothetical protein RLZZ546_783, partial [Bacteroidota bacterium]
SGTAGRPIYGQLLSQNLTDTSIYVVRYFGGTKLGTSGLIAAYKDSSKLAIEQASIVTKSLQEIYELVFEYEHMGKVMNVIKNMDLIILIKNFESQPYVRIAIKSSEVKNKIRKLKADLLEYSLDRIEDETQVPFCKITYLYNQKV